MFTDVLEHLRDPGKVLNAVHPFLKKNGIVCVSLPNISYKTVLIDLVKYDLFEYAPSGILDSTHLRFFTEETARFLFETNQFAVTKVRKYKGSVVRKEKSLNEFPFYVRWYLNKVNRNIDTSVFYFEVSSKLD